MVKWSNGTKIGTMYTSFTPNLSNGPEGSGKSPTSVLKSGPHS